MKKCVSNGLFARRRCCSFIFVPLSRISTSSFMNSSFTTPFSKQTKRNNDGASQLFRQREIRPGKFIVVVPKQKKRLSLIQLRCYLCSKDEKMLLKSHLFHLKSGLLISRRRRKVEQLSCLRDTCTTVHL